MPLNVRTRRRIAIAGAAAACLLAGAFFFVQHFMHSVFEVDAPLEHSAIPAAVQASFEQRYPGAPAAEWEFDEDLYEATFSWQGRDEVEAHFSADGAWVRSVFPAGEADLPEKARAYIAAQKGATVSGVERIELRDARVEYEVELRGALLESDCRFDAEGNLVERIRDGTVLENDDAPAP